MSEVIMFPGAKVVVDADLGLPPKVAVNFARDLGIIAGFSGFIDRIDYAQQALRDAHVLKFAQVIDEEQFSAMVKVVHGELALNLGDC